MKMVVEAVALEPDSNTGIAFGRTDGGTVGVAVRGPLLTMVALALVAQTMPGSIVLDLPDDLVVGGPWEMPESPEG